MNLELIGLNHYLDKIKQAPSKKMLARIFSEHKTDWDLISEDGPLKGILLNTLRKSMDQSQLPKVGDWVSIEKLSGENKAKIVKVLPRYSTLVRHLKKTQSQQIIATNIDTMFIVLSVDQIFNPLQLNRYLTIALEANIRPVIVINKIDKQSGSDNIQKEILAIHPKQNIIFTSAKTKLGLPELEKIIKPGYTAVLVGNSGTGKSSLVNTLLVDAKQSTKEVSDTGKGQHTTTSRQIFVLTNGGIIIDTPGMRTLEFDPNKQSTTSIFTELNELSRQCKYRNCDHIKSAGCALQTALKQNLISQQQFDQYLNISTKHSQKISYHKSKN